MFFHRSKFSLFSAVLLVALSAGLCGATAQPSAPKPAPPVPQAQIFLDGHPLFSVQGALSFTAKARAEAISKRIEDLSKRVVSQPQSLTISDMNGSTDIVAGDLVVMSVTDQDAQAAGKTRQQLAEEYAQLIDKGLVASRHAYSLKSLLLGGLYTLFATAILILILRLLGFISKKIHTTLDSWRGTFIPSLRIQKFELLPANRIADFAMGIVRLARFALTLVILYSYTSLVLGFFPWTRSYSHALLDYVLSPIKVVGAAILSYLPNIFFIAVILLIARFVIKFVRILFTEIEKENITFPNFYAEWAEPTYKIVRTLILALTVVVVFPYLPGSKSPAFQGVSIFLGVLVSLGSSSAVANIVAGIILTYMRAFKIGDRVKIADTVGDVIEKTLLVTRVLTIKNVEVTITNSMVLNSHIVNYSAVAQQGRLILHTTITIGYDAPWRTVHQLLIDAALACDDILHEPKPFVYQTALDDFYVHYQINAYTDQPNRMAQTYANLHAQIQDKFNEGGVEIMSSHYANVREGNRTTIPDAYLPPDYVAPSFRVGLQNPTGGIKITPAPENE